MTIRHVYGRSEVKARSLKCVVELREDCPILLSIFLFLFDFTREIVELLLTLTDFTFQKRGFTSAGPVDPLQQAVRPFRYTLKIKTRSWMKPNLQLFKQSVELVAELAIGLPFEIFSGFHFSGNADFNSLQLSCSLFGNRLQLWC